jgi:predicted RNA-binding protein with PIN domain
VRRIIDGDDEFRARLAEAADPALVDDIGIEWLRRQPGWEARVTELIEQRLQDAAELDVARELAHERRRRLAAESKADRAREDLVTLGARVAELEREIEAQRRHQATSTAEVDSLRLATTELRREVRDTGQRAESARRRAEQLEAERDQAMRRAQIAEEQRDDLLAARAALDGSDGGARITRLRDLAESARVLADRLGSLVAVEPARRVAVDVPRTAARDQHLAAEFLFRVAGIVVLVDGYNVSKLAWPDLTLEDQRLRLMDAVDGLARRFGTEFVIVLDGADVTGAHTDRRRLARIRYSPAGVTADDVIREEIAGLNLARPVAVVTDDREIRRDAIAAGANAIASAALVHVALR